MKVFIMLILIFPTKNNHYRKFSIDNKKIERNKKLAQATLYLSLAFLALGFIWSLRNTIYIYSRAIESIKLNSQTKNVSFFPIRSESVDKSYL